VSGRLNLFQRAMLHWRELHPYNAVHVAHVRGPMPQALAQRIGATLEASGLTGFSIDRARRRFRYAGGPAEVTLEVLPGGSNPFAVVCGEVERQLNLPFPLAAHANPFRFFAVTSADSFHLGLAYDHFVAGGESIVGLLGRIVASCVAPEPPSGPRPELYPPTYSRVLLRHPVALANCLLRLPGFVGDARRSCRPRYRMEEGTHSGLVHFRLDPPRLAALRRASKAWNVTVNDVFLAGLLIAVSPLAAYRHSAPRRRELAVTSVINTRGDFGAAARYAFGQFLASFRVSHTVPHGIGLRELALDVHAQTARIRREKRYLQIIFALGLAGLMWPFLSPHRRAGFFAKYHPVWAGLTTLNVDAVAGESGNDGARWRDYFRVGSTGPLCPMVFAFTTAGDAVRVGVTYRAAALNRSEVEEVVTSFVRCIDKLEPAEACAA
jgi:hypothetical protein